MSAKRALVATSIFVVMGMVGCGVSTGPSDERLAGEGTLPAPSAPADTPSESTESGNAPPAGEPAPTTPTQPAPPSTPPPASPPAQPGDKAKIIFVTSAAVSGRITTGNKSGPGSGGDDDDKTGREAADQICNDEAKKANVAGTFVAWLSKQNEDAIARIPESPAGWALVDGTVVFPNRSHIASGKGPLAKIAKTASGASITTNAGVWTSTYENGKTQNPTCSGWSSTQGTGVGGSLYATDRKWTNDVNTYCWDQRRLVCFQK